MRILALDAALAGCSAALLIDGAIIAEHRAPAGRGQAAWLAPMARAVLADGGVAAASLDGVAASVGPGSFTGLRAALALAHGLALGVGCPAIGVSVAEALAACLPPYPGRVLWVAVDSFRPGRVFLDIGGSRCAALLAALPPASGPVVVAGDAAALVAAALAARGSDVLLSDVRQIGAGDVARVAAARLAGARPGLAAQPLYGDPPAVRLPAPAPAA